jgi:hypothetical protein
MVSAMMPILSAQSISGQVQVRYLGSPGLLSSQVWREVRDRGRAGDATGTGLDRVGREQRPCAMPDCLHVVGSVGLRARRPGADPAGEPRVDRRIHIRFVLETERLAMTPEDFMVERMGWWQDPPNLTGGDLDTDAVGAAGRRHAQQPRSRSSSGSTRARTGRCRSAARGAADGGVQVMLTQDERVDVGLSPDEAVARLVELHSRWGRGSCSAARRSGSSGT